MQLDKQAGWLTWTFEVVPSVIISPFESSTGSPQSLLPESGWLINWEFKSVPFRLPMSTNSHLFFWKPKRKSMISSVPHAKHRSKLKSKWNSYQEITSAFQLIIACFPDTSESFNSKSLETLPRVSGPLIDCTEQRSPREGPEITSRERQLPAFLTEKYDNMFFTFGQIKEHIKK